MAATAPAATATSVPEQQPAPAAGEYRASSADNNGPNLAIYRGRIDGNRLVYESLQESYPRIRLTWILTDPDHCTWRNEFTLDGESWSLIEEYAMVAEGPAS